MNCRFTDKMRIICTACLAASLAVPLAACSDRSAAPEGAQQSTQEMARDQEVERRPGAGQPEVTANDVDYTDEYSEPRESWTGGATAQDAGFASSEQGDVRAERMLAREFAERDGLGAVKVDVEDGVAHLQGEVESIVEQREAETLAMAMEDVVEVRNDLEIAARSD